MTRSIDESDRNVPASSADDLTPLLISPRPRRALPWLWVGLAGCGLALSAWLVIQFSQMYRWGQEAAKESSGLAARSEPADSGEPTDTSDDAAPPEAAESSDAESMDPVEQPSSVEQPSLVEQPSSDEQSNLDEQPSSEEQSRSSEQPDFTKQPDSVEQPSSAQQPDAAPTTTPPDSDQESEPAPRYTPARSDDERARPEVRRLVQLARARMAQADLASAERQLAELRKMSLTPEELLLTERLRTVRFHLERFWVGLESGRQALRVGDRLVIDGQPQRVVGIDLDAVRLEGQDGVESSLEFGAQRYDPRLVSALAHVGLQSQGAPSLLPIAVFWATDRVGDPRQARQWFRAAELQGLPVGQLTWEAEWDGQQEVDGIEPAPTDTRQPVPGAEALATARAKAKDEFGAKFAELGQAEQLEMARTMLKQAQQPTTPLAESYTLMELVQRIASHAGSIELAWEAVDAMFDRFAIPPDSDLHADAWRQAMARIDDEAVRRTGIELAVGKAESLRDQQRGSEALALARAAQSEIANLPGGDESLARRIRQLEQDRSQRP